VNESIPTQHHGNGALGAGAVATAADFVNVTLIPRPDQIHESLRRLEDLFSHFKPQAQALKSRAEALHAVAVKTARDQLDRLREMIPFVDFICVNCLDEIPKLDSECLSATFEECGGKVYSPTAEPHRGVMSGKSKSDAAYAFTHFRRIGGRPVTLLLQNIRERGKTSLHYHRGTTETFVSLFGEAFIYVHDRLKRGEGMIRRLFLNQALHVRPETTHQLLTADRPAVNLLVMDNFDMNADPSLRDHIYQEADSGYHSALKASGLA
jgi:mannose-6-phosphate isomerase-like protein (cupin superfamily)